METTNDVLDLSLYDKLKPETLVRYCCNGQQTSDCSCSRAQMSWIRVVVANRMAANASDW